MSSVRGFFLLAALTSAACGGQDTGGLNGGVGGAQPDGGDGATPVPVEAGAPTGLITCGRITCNATTDVCCDTTPPTCTAIGKCTTASTACSSKANCQNGDVCCGSFTGSSQSAECVGASSCTGVELCQNDADCPSGDSCQGFETRICLPGGVEGDGGRGGLGFDGGRGGFDGGGGGFDGGHRHDGGGPPPPPPPPPTDAGEGG